MQQKVEGAWEWDEKSTRGQRADCRKEVQTESSAETLDKQCSSSQLSHASTTITNTVQFSGVVVLLGLGAGTRRRHASPNPSPFGHVRLPACGRRTHTNLSGLLCFTPQDTCRLHRHWTHRERQTPLTPRYTGGGNGQWRMYDLLRVRDSSYTNSLRLLSPHHVLKLFSLAKSFPQLPLPVWTRLAQAKGMRRRIGAAKNLPKTRWETTQRQLKSTGYGRGYNNTCHVAQQAGLMSC